MTSAGRALLLWRLGRLPTIGLVALILSSVAAFRWWYVGFPTYLLGQPLPRMVYVIVVAPLFSGLLAITCLAPRLPRIDRLADWRRRAASATAVAVVTVAASATPVLVVLVLSVVPVHWVPAYRDYVPAGGRLLDNLNLGLLTSFSATILGIVGAGVVAVSLLGRVAGAACALLLYPAVVVVQSIDTIRPALTDLPPSAWLAASALLALAGITIWYRTGAGAPVLVRLT